MSDRIEKYRELRQRLRAMEQSDWFRETYASNRADPAIATCTSCAKKDAEIERLREGVSVEFQSAVSGLWYTKRGAAGDVSAIKVDGELFKMVNAVEAVPVEELETLIAEWEKTDNFQALLILSRCIVQLRQKIDQAREGE